MNITVINGSPRRNGNTEIMVDEFIKGAKENGHDVTKINLAGKKIAGCLGCQYCFSHDGVCIQKDDMNDILEALDQTDMVVFASPIYWFYMTSQIKAMIDRMYARGKKGLHFNKTALLLDAGAEGVFDSSITQYKITCNYLKWENKGIITIGGMKQKGDMAKNPRLIECYELGRNI